MKIKIEEGRIYIPTSILGEYCTFGDTVQMYLQKGIIKQKLFNKEVGDYVITEYQVPERWAFGEVMFHPNSGVRIKIRDIYYPNPEETLEKEPIKKLLLRYNSRVFFKVSSLIKDDAQLRSYLSTYGRKTAKKIAERQGYK